MSILTIHRSRWSAAALVDRGDLGLSAATSVPTLTAHEHVLYRSMRDGSQAAVGTDAALHYRRPGGAWRRIAWIDLIAANWSARTRSVELRSTLPNGERIRIAADRTLAAFAAERIAHLRILRRRVELRPGVFGIVEAVRVRPGGAAMAGAARRAGEPARPVGPAGLPRCDQGTAVTGRLLSAVLASAGDCLWRESLPRVA